MKHLFKPLVLGLAFTLHATTASALEEIKGSVFQILNQVELNADGQNELKRFRAAPAAYGSMYVSRDGSTGAWRSDQFSLAMARKLSETICRQVAQGPCVEIARAVPRNSVGAVAIPKRAQSDFRNAIRETTSGRYAAFAAHGMGGWGFGNNFNNLDEARTRAVLECQASSARDRAKHDKSRRQAFERAGLYNCAIIYTIQKK
ncbi:MAG: hypothetical protein ABJP79_09650 [Tateyamaria sp.]|uniref:hypothetical protein n=1 Tax=Tateyamaria sp. TaxID=1929288 RepID=UPI00329B57B6